jgi:kynureninase
MPMTARTPTRADLERLDAVDPLAAFRGAFDLPQGVIYLDGNSLGALPKATPARLADVATREWGADLIRSWNTNGWIEAPQRVGDKIARLIGAAPGEVVAADSTSVNLFKLLAGAISLRPGRRTILTEPGNFPTDLYMMQGLERLLGDRIRIRIEPAETLADAIDEDVIAVSLTHVHYKSARRWPMAQITAKAHAHGALAIWDLSHSAGALAIDLNAANADLAVGCGYKYLNGGPGAPAFQFVAERHQALIRSPLTGWMGHADPFAFVDDFTPAAGIKRQLCGTPAILSLAALEVGIDLMLRADMAALEAKGGALGDAFIALVEARCAGMGLTLASPRDAAARGSHVVFAHPEAYAVMQALIERGVIGDFRAPDMLRFGFTPLYARFTDMFDAVEILHAVLAEGAHRDPRFQQRLSVT